MTETFTSGRPGQIKFKCPLESDAKVKCWFEPSLKKPKCKGPDDINELIVNIYRPIAGLLGKLIDRFLTAEHASFGYVRYRDRDADSIEELESLLLVFQGEKPPPESEIEKDKEKIASKSGFVHHEEITEEDKKILYKPNELLVAGNSLKELERFGKLKKIIIRGYTDKRGDEISNIKLSVARAKWVKEQLLNRFGIPDDLPIELVGCGLSHARDSKKNDDLEHRAVSLEVIADSASIIPLEYPHPPQNLKAKTEKVQKPNSTTEYNIELEWDVSKNADSYTIYWSYSEKVTNNKNHVDIEFVDNIKDTKYKFEKMDIDEFSGIYFVVTSVNTNGESLTSNKVYAGGENPGGWITYREQYWKEKQHRSRIVEDNVPEFGRDGPSIIGREVKPKPKPSVYDEDCEDLPHLFPPKYSWRSRLRFEFKDESEDSESEKADKNIDDYDGAIRKYQKIRTIASQIASNDKQVRLILEKAEAYVEFIAIYMILVELKESDHLNWKSVLKKVEEVVKKEKLEIVRYIEKRINNWYPLLMPHNGSTRPCRMPPIVPEPIKEMPGRFREIPKRFKEIKTFSPDYPYDKIGRAKKPFNMISRLPEYIYIPKEILKIRFHTGQPEN